MTHRRYCQECHNRPNELLSPDEFCMACREGRTQIVHAGFFLVFVLCVATYYMRMDADTTALIDNSMFRFCLVVTWALGVFSYLNQRLSNGGMNIVLVGVMCSVFGVFLLCIRFQPWLGMLLEQVWCMNVF